VPVRPVARDSRPADHLKSFVCRPLFLTPSRPGYPRQDQSNYAPTQSCSHREFPQGTSICKRHPIKVLCFRRVTLLARSLPRVRNRL